MEAAARVMAAAARVVEVMWVVEKEAKAVATVAAMAAEVMAEAVRAVMVAAEEKVEAVVAAKAAVAKAAAAVAAVATEAQAVEAWAVAAEVAMAGLAAVEEVTVAVGRSAVGKEVLVTMVETREVEAGKVAQKASEAAVVSGEEMADGSADVAGVDQARAQSARASTAL